MVGLIFVSDSHEFVIALQKYINKVGNVSTACSGGVGENNSFLGTNHNDIYKVIRKEYNLITTNIYYTFNENGYLQHFSTSVS